MSKGIFLWNIARFSFLPYCKKHYHIHIQGDIPQPPFLIVSNHVSSVDPFLIGPFLPYPVSWVVAQISFQHPIERFFLRKTGAIPKSKSRPDPATVNAIFQIIRQGGIAGLFPEGTITWTGEFQDSLLGSGIERLINNLDVPILGVRIQGAWLSKPVWALRAREGHVFLHFQTFHDPDVLRFIHHSEWDWQKEHLIRYSGKNKALGIERVLWICPQCGGFRTLSGNGDHAVCSSCRQTWAIDEYGFIGGCSLPEFIHHQDNDFPSFLKSHPFFTIPRVTVVQYDAKTFLMQRIFRGDLHVSPDSLACQEIRYKIANTRGINTHFNQILEFLHGDSLVRIKTFYSSYFLYQYLNFFLERNVTSE